MRLIGFKNKSQFSKDKAEAAAVFIEGWAGILGRHFLMEDVSTTYVVGASKLVLDKVVSMDGTLKPDDIRECVGSLPQYEW